MKKGKQLRAGVAEVDISPPPGVQIVGYPTVVRPNTGIHDPLMADCLVLDDGSTRLAVITADIVGYEKQFVRRLRDSVQRETGIPAGRHELGQRTDDETDHEGDQDGHDCFLVVG